MIASIAEKLMEGLLAKIPLRRLAKPEEIAEAHLFLASDGAAYITGQVLFVDGGVSGGGRGGGEGTGASQFTNRKRPLRPASCKTRWPWSPEPAWASGRPSPWIWLPTAPTWPSPTAATPRRRRRWPPALSSTPGRRWPCRRTWPPLKTPSGSWARCRAAWVAWTS